jgi:RimJ/RimL family protein N-acetyltransferase
LDDVLAFHAHPSVRQVTADNITPTKEGVQEYIKTQMSLHPFEKDAVFDLAIERKEDQKVIGLLTLVNRDHRQGEIGWALGIEYRGRGYATEGAFAQMNYGFRTLGLHRIHAETSSTNQASLKVMERIGMRREARLREAVSHAGKYTDKVIYACTSDEFPAMTSQVTGTQDKKQSEGD